VSMVTCGITQILKCMISEKGNPIFYKGKFKEGVASILIGESWREDKEAEKKLQDGGTYGGKGYWKFCVRVRTI
jgi:hypothetical protein